MTRLLCRDYLERPGCLGDADERYTMRFDDIGKQPLHWCAFCGPEAHAMNDALMAAFETRPSFAAEFEAELAKAEAERAKGAS